MHSFGKYPINSEILQHLLEYLKLYRSGNVGLNALSRELEEVRYNLYQPDEDWVEDYLKLWGVVEECNALTLDVSHLGVLPRHEDLLVATIKQLENLICQTLDKNN